MKNWNLLKTREIAEDEEDGAVFGSLYNPHVHYTAQPSLIMELTSFTSFILFFMHGWHVLTNIYNHS